MSARSEAMRAAPLPRARDRLAAGFLILLMGVGSIVLWLGIPVAGLWFFSKVTDSWNGHFLLSLTLIPAAMALFAPVLFWLNGLYLRVIGVLGSDEEDEDRRWSAHGPLELFLYAGMVIALVALFVWFFFFARNPPEIVW